jgi:hypothetical protein
VSAFVEQLIANLKRSAPSCPDEDLVRIQQLLQAINPRSDPARSDCDLLAGYLSGALPTADGISDAFERRRRILEEAVRPGDSELDRRLREVISRLGGAPPKPKKRAVPKKPVRPWLDETKLPGLFHRDGRPVEHEVTRTMLALQSRAKGPELDPEVRRIAGELDPDRSGDFALAVLNLFIAKREETKDKFCIAIAAALGDDRIAVPLKRKILEWPEVRRGKLSEFAAAALASSGSAIALFTVDSVARRLRTQRRIQAHAARELILEAARARGVDRETLIDDLIPWHGFAGRTRMVGQGDRAVTVHVGTDFKIQYTTAAGKIAKSLSKTLPEAEREQVADLAKNLRDLIKAHSIRLADRMISQRGWSAERWRSLFLEHPLLFPFAVRCIYSAHAGGSLAATFRALDDGTLTNTDDDEVELRPEWEVRLLHPSSVAEELRVAWASHLADYEVEQPFSQLDRPAVRVSQDDAQIRIGRTFAGRPWDPFERSRFVRRAGWKQLTVYESQWSACFKTFPGADEDVDVVLMIDQHQNVITGHYFSRYRLDTVESGSFYLPGGDDDPRLMRLGEVPRAIYAEAFGELSEMF